MLQGLRSTEALTIAAKQLARQLRGPTGGFSRWRMEHATASVLRETTATHPGHQPYQVFILKFLTSTTLAPVGDLE